MWGLRVEGRCMRVRILRDRGIEGREWDSGELVLVLVLALALASTPRVGYGLRGYMYALSTGQKDEIRH